MLNILYCAPVICSEKQFFKDVMCIHFMVSKERWEKAQDYERKWWKKKAKNNESFAVSETKSITFLGETFCFNENTRSLNIGGGPRPAWLAGEFYVLDPLADFFKTSHKQELQHSFVKGEGEKMPFKDNYFDFIMCTNSLDHMRCPETVLLEINRCLKKNGFLCFSVTVYENCAIPSILSKLGLGHFKAHPFVFTPPVVENAIENFFTIKKEKLEWSSSGSYDLGFKIKLFNLLITKRGVFYAICRKKAA